MKESNLELYQRYVGKTGNHFVLFKPYHPNKKCFIRGDGERHFGREFIEFRNGERIIDLEEAA